MTHAKRFQLPREYHDRHRLRREAIFHGPSGNRYHIRIFADGSALINDRACDHLPAQWRERMTRHEQSLFRTAGHAMCCMPPKVIAALVVSIWTGNDSLWRYEESDFRAAGLLQVYWDAEEQGWYRWRESDNAKWGDWHRPANPKSSKAAVAAGKEENGRHR